MGMRSQDKNVAVEGGKGGEWVANHRAEWARKPEGSYTEDRGGNSIPRERETDTHLGRESNQEIKLLGISTLSYPTKKSLQNEYLCHVSCLVHSTIRRWYLNLSFLGPPSQQNFTPERQKK